MADLRFSRGLSRGRGRHERALSAGAAALPEPVPALGQAGAQGPRRLPAPAPLRPPADPLRARLRLPRGGSGAGRPAGPDGVGQPHQRSRQHLRPRARPLAAGPIESGRHLQHGDAPGAGDASRLAGGELVVAGALQERRQPAQLQLGPAFDEGVAAFLARAKKRSSPLKAFVLDQSVLAGIVAALQFFGCVPRELWWDNPKTVAWAIFLASSSRNR